MAAGRLTVRRVGYGRPEWYFRKSVATPCHTPMSIVTQTPMEVQRRNREGEDLM
jgi:hypothetical protein